MVIIEQILDNLFFDYEMVSKEEENTVYLCNNNDINFVLINDGDTEYSIFCNIITLSDNNDYLDLLKIVNKLNQKLLYGTIYIEEENGELNIEYYIGVINNGKELYLKEYLAHLTWIISRSRIEILKFKKESASKKLKELIISEDKVI